MSRNPDNMVHDFLRPAPGLLRQCLTGLAGMAKLSKLARILATCLLIGTFAMQAATAAAATATTTAPELPRWSRLAETLFQHVAAGLPNPFITALAEDGDGFLWVGTQGGLARWDGYRFRTYLPDPKDPGSLPDIHIRKLHTDRRGRLWIGTNGGGLARYDSVQDHFVRIANDRGNPDNNSGNNADNIGNATVFSIVDDHADGLWVGTSDGLVHLIGDAVIHFRHDDKDARTLPSDRILALLQDAGGRLWVGTRNGVVIRDTRTGAFFPVPMLAGPGAPPVISSLAESADGRIWVGTNDNGVFVVDANTLAASPLRETGSTAHTLNHVPVPFIQETTPGQVWIGTFGQGMVVVDSKHLQTRRLRHDNSAPASLGDDAPQAIVRDRSGLIWVGGLRGLNRHNPNQSAVLTLPGDTLRPDSLSDSNIIALTPMPDNSVWLGLPDQGLNIIDPAANRIIQRKPGSGLTPGFVHAITTPFNNTVYLGTSRGLYRTGFSGGPIEAVNLPPRDLGVAVNTLLREGNQLWIGGPDGLWLTRLDGPSPLKAQRVPGTSELDSAIIDVLERGPDGSLWIGTTDHGLFRLDPAGQPLHAISADPANPAALSAMNIASLLFDTRGRLWVGTQGGGISLLSEPNQPNRKPVFKRIGAAEGLPNNLVNKLLEDGQGHIWASTDAGIAIIDGSTLAVQTLEPADGLAISGYWSNSGGKTAQGELLFGGAGGLTVIQPERYQPWDYQPPIVVTHVQLSGKGQAASRFNYAPLANSFFADQSIHHKLFIQPQANSIAVEFSALDYSDPERNRYAYQLDGFDRDWSSADANHRIATYTNLPPGEYRLRLRGSNRNGVWATQERVVPILVLPAWYQTWWSRLMQAMLATAAIYALIWARTHYFRQRQHELESLVQERTVALHQKQTELVNANQELHDAILSANEANAALNQANASLILSVETLRELGDIGREITANLDAGTVFQSLYLHIGSLLGAQTMAIFQMNPGATALELAFGRENGQDLPRHIVSLDSPTSWVARAARERRELALNLNPGKPPPNHVTGTENMLAALFAPLIVDHHVLGVMTIQTAQSNAYGERERLIFRTLSAYGAIALANAQALAALHEAQGQLVEQEKMASLGGLVAGIAHEINTPLGTTLMAISGASSAWHSLQDATSTGRLSKSLLHSSTEQGIEYTNLALRTATRAAELIAVFKTVSVSAETDRAENIDLAQYLAEAASLVQSPLEQLGCTLEIEAAPNLNAHVVTEALTEALTRVFLNVLDHAFTEGRTGTLRLCAQESEQGELTITISDNGHGIAADHLSKVFDPFFSTKSGLKGHVGLGLHVAYNHVTQRLKGKISITSTQGQGTRVSIQLKKHVPVPHTTSPPHRD